MRDVRKMESYRGGVASRGGGRGNVRRQCDKSQSGGTVRCSWVVFADFTFFATSPPEPLRCAGCLFSGLFFLSVGSVFNYTPLNVHRLGGCPLFTTISFLNKVYFCDQCLLHYVQKCNEY